MMQVGCSICANDTRRRAIDDALIAGRSVRAIEAEFGVPKSTVHLHKARCLKALIVKTAEERNQGRGNELLDKLDGLLKKAMDVVKRAEKGGNDALVLKALNEARDTVRLIGDFTGARPEPPPRVSYEIIFQAGRPVARQAEVIEIPALELKE